MAKARSSKSTFEARARAAGLRLDVHRLDELYGAYGTLEAMIARVQGPLRVKGSLRVQGPSRGREVRARAREKR
ncbi:MAG TPA: hypothetical protein VMF53_17105 [Alphaproteobacteria bacterium]|nr:hypothetical protein [Alphaproteobacteria bacterium]